MSAFGNSTLKSVLLYLFTILLFQLQELLSLPVPCLKSVRKALQKKTMENLCPSLFDLSNILKMGSIEIGR